MSPELLATMCPQPTARSRAIADTMREVNATIPAIGQALIGSAYINGTPLDSVTTDIDILVHVPDGHIMTSSVALTDAGWVHGGSGGPAEDWASLRKSGTPINLILTDNPKPWLMAADVCRTVVAATGEPMSKMLRVALHRVVMDGMAPQEAIGTAHDDVGQAP